MDNKKSVQKAETKEERERRQQEGRKRLLAKLRKERGEGD